MPLFSRGRGKKGQRGEEEEEDEFAASALDKVTERQDEMESVVKDFIGESKRRFEDLSNRMTTMTAELEKVRTAIPKYPISSMMRTAPGQIVVAGNPAETATGAPAEPSEGIPMELAKLLGTINTRLERLEKAATEKAEEEEVDPVQVVMKEAYEDLRKKIAKDIAATIKSSTYKVADSYRSKIKTAVLRETEKKDTATGSTAPRS